MLGTGMRAGRSRVVATTAVALVVAAAVVLTAVVLSTRAGREEPTNAVRTTGFVRTAEHGGGNGLPDGPVLFVGASYTAALGATDAGHGYAAVTAQLLGRTFVVAAVPGTGFVCTGPHHEGAFARRVDDLPAGSDFPLVIVQGGRNDAAFPPALVSQAARDTLMSIRSRFPSARVVVMGPILGVMPGGPALARLRDAQRAAARAAGAGFVDPLAENWITPTNVARFTGRVAAHPNDAGYAYIAHRLVDDLPAALRSTDTPTGSRRPNPSAPAGDPAAPVVITPPATDAPPEPTDPSDPTGTSAPVVAAVEGPA